MNGRSLPVLPMFFMLALVVLLIIYLNGGF